MRAGKNRDRFEAPLTAAHSLARTGSYDEACAILAKARDEASLSGKNDEASLFSSVIGSYLSIAGKNEEAFDAYRQAERFSQGDVHARLITVRHLIYGMKKPDEALARLENMFAEHGNDPLPPEARALRGTANFFLGRTDEAIRELDEMARELASGETSGLSCDLTLVEELCRAQLGPEVCNRYLDLVDLSNWREGGTGQTVDKIPELRKMNPRPER